MILVGEEHGSQKLSDHQNWISANVIGDNIISNNMISDNAISDFNMTSITL